MHGGIRAAIQAGDVAKVNALFAANPAIVHDRIDGQRTLLHITVEWPGRFPRIGEGNGLMAAKQGRDFE